MSEIKGFVITVFAVALIAASTASALIIAAYLINPTIGILAGLFIAISVIGWLNS